MFETSIGNFSHHSVLLPLLAYTCPYEGCDKSFSVISNAKRHYRTHLVELPPDQMGLPSGPYTVNFSEPVVVPDSPSHPQLYYAPSPSTSTSSLATSLSPSSESSSTSIPQAHSLRYPSRSRSVSLQPSAMPLPAVEEAFGEAPSQSLSRRQNLKARTLRWLPMGSDSRTPWKANAATSRVR